MTCPPCRYGCIIDCLETESDEPCPLDETPGPEPRWGLTMALFILASPFLLLIWGIS